jgi:hypothetical protein
MKKRLKTVLRTTSQEQLGEQLGISHSRVSQILKDYPDAWVLFDDSGKPIDMEWLRVTNLRKRKHEAIHRL